MDITAYRNEIKLKVTGNILELELDDSTLDMVIQSALREIQRYICVTKIVTIPFSKCIDLSNVTDEDGNKIKVSSVSRIYRARSYMADTEMNGNEIVDPMYAAQWQMLAGTSDLSNFQNYVYNYGAWNTLLQIKNTTSTDLAFRYDKMSDKLYINTSSGIPDKITVEYVPRFDDVSEVKSDYWIDMLVRMSVALTKVTLGRVRSRYTQANALWTQDGETMLAEGNAELETLREVLSRDTQLVYGID